MKNIKNQKFLISRTEREKKLSQSPKVIWFTGLSGSGKSTLANNVEKKLFEKGFLTYILDGDNTRLGINSDLGFSLKDRSENIRRVAEISKLMIDSGIIVIASFISPLLKDRKIAKQIIGEENYLEIYVSTPIEICEKRDIKGLYKRARIGEISDFTGISSPYEEPLEPFLRINTNENDIDKSTKKIIDSILKIISHD